MKDKQVSIFSELSLTPADLPTLKDLRNQMTYVYIVEMTISFLMQATVNLKL